MRRMTPSRRCRITWFPSRGNQQQLTARPAGFAEDTEQIPFSSWPESVRILGTWRYTRAFVRLNGFHVGKEARHLTARQQMSGVATRKPLGSETWTRGSIVSASLINTKKAPATLSKSRGRATGPCSGGPRPADHPYQRVQVIDMTQGTRTLPQTHSTPPWCQQRVSDRWPFGGAFVLRTAVCPSLEGSGMS